MTKYYAVKRGLKPGVYCSWEECSKQVIKFRGSIFKSFTSKSEALKFVSDGVVVSRVPRTVLVGSTVRVRPTIDRASTSSSSSRFAPISMSLKRKMGSLAKGACESSQVGLAIYTDGACKGNNNVHAKESPAGWGVVICNSESDEIFYELYGPVVLNKCSPFYMNATVGSNNTAELSAIGEALLWVRDYGLVHKGSVTIRYDSEYAAKSVQGIFNGKKNSELIEYIRRVLRVLDYSHQIKWEHVKGHSNNPMNDRADELAGRGARGETCTTHNSRYAAKGDDEISTKKVRSGEEAKKATDEVIDLT